MTYEEVIDKIQQNFSIVDLVNPYSELVAKDKNGQNLTGICPFCNSKKAFVVSGQKNICKCFRCGNGGGPINFIMALENLEFKIAIDFILTKFSNTLEIESFSNRLLKGKVYVLKLEHECYYIGFSRNFNRRLEDHFSGNGAVWTKKHKPISIMKVYEYKTLNFENYLTEKGIIKYGYKRVRGGDHLFFAKKYGNYKNFSDHDFY